MTGTQNNTNDEEYINSLKDEITHVKKLNQIMH